MALNLHALPGGDLVEEGLADLVRGIESIPALLVSIGAPRLRRIGLPVPDQVIPTAEHRLYELLARSGTDSAHSRYNALVRRLVSFERAAECGGRAALPEGTTVTLFEKASEGTVRLTPALQAELEDALEQADHEEGISWESLVGRLQKYE